MHTATRWDIFCRVIDNYGDIGVCWRLAADLASRRHSVRLWVDDPSALDWMAPGALQGRWDGIAIHDWRMASDTAVLSSLAPADVWIEAFGCDIPEAFLAHHLTATPAARSPPWINLEYLSAERFAERAHRLPSPVMHGIAKGCTKHFFYPGFTSASGGLLRETDVSVRQAAFDRADWLSHHGIHWHGEQLVALFCYEPAALASLLGVWQAQPRPTRLLVTSGRATAAVRSLPASKPCHEGPAGNLIIDFLPALSQRDFDHLLWACDLNLVRGEDSVVRALWAGQPFIWQIYPQDDDAHHAKLDAFLRILDAPAPVRAAHAVWNGVASGPMALPALDAWSAWTKACRHTLLAQSDLTTRLNDFVAFVRDQGRQAAENR